MEQDQETITSEHISDATSLPAEAVIETLDNLRRAPNAVDDATARTPHSTHYSVFVTDWASLLLSTALIVAIGATAWLVALRLRSMFKDEPLILPTPET